MMQIDANWISLGSWSPWISPVDAAPTSDGCPGRARPHLALDTAMQHKECSPLPQRSATAEKLRHVDDLGNATNEFGASMDQLTINRHAHVK